MSIDRREDAGDFYPGGKVISTQPLAPGGDYLAKEDVVAPSDTAETGQAADAKATHDQLAGKVPTSRTINGKALSSDVTLTGADIAVSGSDATKISAALAGKEDASNKVTSLTAQSTDTQYPSAKCVYDALQGVDVKPTRIYNDDGTDALDDKGQLFKSSIPGASKFLVTKDRTTSEWPFYRYQGEGNAFNGHSVYSYGTWFTDLVCYDPEDGVVGFTHYDSEHYRRNTYVWDVQVPKDLDPGTIGTVLFSGTLSGMQFGEDDFRDVAWAGRVPTVEPDPYARFAIENMPTAWAASTTYTVGVCASYDGKAYRCKTEHTSGSTFDASKWDEIPVLSQKQDALSDAQLANIAAVSDALAFDATHSYAAGDPVVYNGTLYTFTAAHTGTWTGSDASAVDIIARLAGKLDKSAVVAPSTSASDTGKAADAKATGDALLAKRGYNDLSYSEQVVAWPDEVTFSDGYTLPSGVTYRLDFNDAGIPSYINFYDGDTPVGSGTFESELEPDGLILCYADERSIGGEPQYTWPSTVSIKQTRTTVNSKLMRDMSGGNYDTAQKILDAINSVLVDKADRAANPTAGNLAALDTDGNPVDAGWTAGDLARYSLTVKTISNNAVTLDDRADNYVDARTLGSSDSLDIDFPAFVDGKSRDFVLAVECGANPPAISYAAFVTIMAEDASTLTPEEGMNIYAFTEFKPNMFLASRKTADTVVVNTPESADQLLLAMQKRGIDTTGTTNFGGVAAALGLGDTATPQDAIDAVMN